MESTTFFAQLLALRRPWTVARVTTSPEGKEVGVWLRHQAGARFSCPACGTALPVYDHVAGRRWRHVDSGAFTTHVHARMPRVRCWFHGVRQARVPWALPRSQFTLAFERWATPRFARLNANGAEQVRVDWRRWEAILGDQESGVAEWEQAVLGEVEKTPGDSDSWPDSIHDALAVAGKEMSRLGEERQRLTTDFANRLVETIQIDESRFTGMTYIRGSQASFDQKGWDQFRDLLRRNRRARRADPTTNEQAVKMRYAETSAKLTQNRQRFSALDAAIDRVMWRLVGLGPDGSLPQ